MRWAGLGPRPAFIKGSAATGARWRSIPRLSAPKAASVSTAVVLSAFYAVVVRHSYAASVAIVS